MLGSFCQNGRKLRVAAGAVGAGGASSPVRGDLGKPSRMTKSLALFEKSPALGSFCQNESAVSSAGAAILRLPPASDIRSVHSSSDEVAHQKCPARAMCGRLHCAASNRCPVT